MKACIKKGKKGPFGSSPLLSTGEVTPGKLGLVLGSSVKGRYGHTGGHQAKGHENPGGAGASPMREG